MYNKIILHTHVFIPKEELGDLHPFSAQYTHQSKYDPGLKIETFKETSSLFGLPRHGIRLHRDMAKEIIDKRTLGSEHVFTSSIKLWDYQEKALSEFDAYVAKGGTGFFLEAKPGSGKTIMGIEMVRRLHRTALIIVPKMDLVHQWIARFKQFTDLTDDDIGVGYGGNCVWEGKKVVIGLVHTVVKDRFGPDFKDNFGVVLFDECDSSVPPATFAPVAAMFPAKYRIGMTASATRVDGLHKVFHDHVAQFHIKCSGSNTMKPRVIVHQYLDSSGEIPHYLEGMSQLGVMISNIASNPVRNRLIASYAQRCFDKNLPTLIISDRKEQLNTLHKIMVNNLNIPENIIGYFTADVKKKERERVAKQCSIILGTYGMIKRGTDIQRLTVLILATPQGDMRQTQGRIERFLSGKTEPIIVDIVDMSYQRCLTSFKRRLSHYRANDLKIIEAKT